MSGFTALNIEPEDLLVEEVDDTKEIQIEEAFKLYQNALKLHSQGPNYFDAAEEAYRELFQSEVFKYPEAVTDYGHEQLDDTVALPTPAQEQAPIILPTNAADSAANSLPQLIYLSYKNRGQFVLDVARHKLDHAVTDRRSACLYYYQYCLKSLEDSASALERDDTDLDLWKKAARISDVLYSQRLVRFCLESVVAGDDDTGEQTVDLSGLDEAFASSELLQVLQMIQDDTAVVKSSAMQAQPGLLSLLQTSNDPYPFLPPRAAKLEYLHDKQHVNSFQVNRTHMDLQGHSQTAFAEAFAKSFADADELSADSVLGAIVTISLPPSLGGEVSLAASEMQESFNLDREDPAGKATLQQAHAESISPNESAQSPASYHSAQDEVQPTSNIESSVPQQLVNNPPDEDVALHDSEQSGARERLQTELRLPTRKRSSTAAGNEEPESRTKSKRLRARESLMEIAAHEEETALENDYYIRGQLAIIEDADSACFTYVNKILAKLGVAPMPGTTTVEDLVQHEEVNLESSQSKIRESSIDLNAAVNAWTEELSSAILTGHNFRDNVEKSGGMSLFQQHLKATLPKDIAPHADEDTDDAMITFARVLNRSQHTLADAAIAWLVQLFTSSKAPKDLDSFYLRGIWSNDTKEDVVKVLMHVDEILFSQAVDHALSTDNATSPESTEGIALLKDLPNAKAAEVVQTVFELHLDEYYNMISPEGSLDGNAKIEQRDRLQRWAHMMTDMMQKYCNAVNIDKADPLVLRYLLMSALFAGLLADENKSHILACLADVRAVLEQAGNPVIPLPNNRAMPQVSIAAIDQEVSRLSTLDFFNSVFESDNSDPVAVIMKLEPVLESGQVVGAESAQGHSSGDKVLSDQTAQLQAFLDSGDASLKLFLWRRLQNAYTAVSYTPKVISCQLRSMETIVEELSTHRHKSLEPQERQLTMCRWLRDADEIMIKILSKVSDETKPFECLDEQHLSSSISAVSSLLGMLYHFIKYDDSVRVGQSSPPSFRNTTAMKSFEKSRDRTRDAFVRGWTLMYYLVREATIQLPYQFERPVDELAEYLRLVHNILGPRQYCKQCNKLFVKLAKNELLSIRSEIDYAADIAQILYDVYQIKLGSGFGDENHGCTADALGRDKETAFNLVPVIMTYARKLNMRELMKSDLKGTVEKIQQTLGQGKGSPALIFNRKAVASFLKSMINPQEVYRSLKGLGDLITKPVLGEHAKIASQGWYKMLGTMSLAKYKSIKRVNPTPTDDLDTAGTFLKQDLEHNAGDWETWYRLAQVFDAKIEDNLIWNSLKINDSRSEIVSLERSAINAYTMAIATAMRSADDNTDTVQKISDMFSEFAFRLYASSRPPLDMEAFSTDKHMRHLSSSQDQSMSKAPFITPFKPYTVWSLAAYLLQRKFATGQKEWLCYYTLSKCFWKMYQHKDNAKAKKPVTVEDVLEACTDAIDLLPVKEKASEYILEPHYKIVSVVYKLVSRRLLSEQKGIEYLQATQFARVVRIDPDGEDWDWDIYVLEILRKLGQADKSNWHHRIAARAAHINYDDDPSVANALGAKHQFTQQIFTKTMTMQVWKPEYERPGRHYVYTGRYLAFFVLLLDRLNDRNGLEQLVRRIRRKITDFLDHPKVWEETALTYVKLLRRIGKIPEGYERQLFDKISYEDFSKMSEKVEKWAHDPENTSPYQDIVQDAIELKKLNNSLMKGPAIDDLIGDAYACMYEAFVAQLPPEEAAPSSASVLPQGTFINMSTDVVPTGDDNLDRMRLNNLLSGQSDGPATGFAPAVSTVGLGLNTSSVGMSTVEPVRIPTPSKPGRTKTITRREVQRKAEACLVKPPPVKTLMKRLFVDLPGRRESAASNFQEASDYDKGTMDDDVPNSSKASSRRPSMSPRGSVDPDEADRDAEGEEGDDNGDEADDESESSDLDNGDDNKAPTNDKTIKSPFPSLKDRKRKAEDDDDGEESEGEAEDEAGSDDEQEEEQDDENEDEDDGDEMGAEQDKYREMEEAEDSVLEIQDSQEQGQSGSNASRLRRGWMAGT